MGYDYYGNSYNNAFAVGFGAALGIIAFVWIIISCVYVFSVICNWKIFKKAGKKGWESIIPIYNIIVLIEISGLPLWYIALLIVPFANIYAVFKIYIELAKKFGQSTAFGFGLALLNPIFMAILAFNKQYVYEGNVVNNNQAYMQQPINNYMYNGQPIYNQNMQQPVQPNMEMNNSMPVQNNVCLKCGSPTNAGDRFCMNCGNQL